MKKSILLISFMLGFVFAKAQDIPEHISYSRIYEFIDELATDGVIEINSVAKPYSRLFIAEKLVEASSSKELNKRQKDELQFFLNEFALELDKLPKSILGFGTKTHSFELFQPAFNYRDSMFKARISPILGMHILSNDNGTLIKRWVGADFQSIIAKNLTVYGSLRDISVDASNLAHLPASAGLLARPTYLNDYPGYEYKESSVGGDFSDSRGGIKYSWKWGSVGLVKDNIVWGDNYHGSNIISGRAPSFPMITFHLKPTKWFEMQYIHGWLVSNVADSTRYYLDNEGNKSYRMANKFIAANLFTFTPVSKLDISFGNSIIYGEQNIQPAYLLPIAFYKSIDHTLTKGLLIENQNSQLFLNFSSRNIKHLHLYTSVFADEISFSRFLPSVAEKNPISYKVGAHVSNFPIQNLSITTEFTKSAILTYKHFIPGLTYASNNYSFGSYLGDNSDELYLALAYKPFRGLDLNLSYVEARHGNEFNYISKRNDDGYDLVNVVLAQPVLGDVAWSNQTLALNARFEIFNNAYALVNVENSNIRANNVTSKVNQYYNNLESPLAAQGFLDLYTPKYLQGQHTTVTFGFSFGF